MMILYVIIGILAVLLLGTCIFYGYFFHYTFGKKKCKELTSFIKKNENYKDYVKLIEEGANWFDECNNKENVYIESFDGLKLHGVYIPSYSDKLIILFHGYHSISKNDFSSVFVPYHEMGLNILLVDQRSHGESEGKWVTFGVNERFDVIEWVKFAKEKYPDKKIYLGGISMGASTVMMASEFVNDDVLGIIADCGFTSPKDIIRVVGKQNFHIPKPFIAPIGWLAKIISKFDYSVSTKDALRKTTVPILFVHGTSDSFVPVYMTEENYDVCASEKKVIYIDNAGHGFAFLVEREKMISEVREFIFGKEVEN